jgi:hypothetical protein
VIGQTVHPQTVNVAETLCTSELRRQNIEGLWPPSAVIASLRSESKCVFVEALRSAVSFYAREMKSFTEDVLQPLESSDQRTKDTCLHSTLEQIAPSFHLSFQPRIMLSRSVVAFGAENRSFPENLSRFLTSLNVASWLAELRCRLVRPGYERMAPSQESNTKSSATSATDQVPLIHCLFYARVALICVCAFSATTG